MLPCRSARRTDAAVLLAALCLAAPVPANTVVLTSSKDNTLIEAAGGAMSNALGDVFAGRVGVFGSGTTRRGLMTFDIAGNIPAGSTINSVTLTLTLVSAPFGSGNQPVELHRALADWGEGTSFFPGGQGAPSTPGDATWIHTFFDTQFWAKAGGDFMATPSASILVGTTTGPYTWPSTGEVVADVQAWLHNPGSNFGWLIKGNEDATSTVRRFGSREALRAQRPVLTVEFTPPAPCPWDCGDGNHVVDVIDFLALLSQWPGPGTCDVNADGVIDIVDFLDLLSHYMPCP